MLKFRIGVYSVLIALCFASPLYAKISAKDSAEKFMMSLGKSVPDFEYNCQGDDIKASCVAKKIDIENEISLRNVKLDYMRDDNNLNHAIAFDVQVLDPKIDKEVLGFIPKKITCSSPSSLRGKIYEGKLTCELNASAYVLKLKGIGALVSNKFLNKEIGVIFDELEQIMDDITPSNSQQKLKDYKVDIKEMSMDIKGIQFADKMLSALKKNEPNYTKEQYNATVNMGVAMVPVGLANAGASESTLEQVSKAAAALGDIATSKKQQATITLKRKTTNSLELWELLDMVAKMSDPYALLRLLDDYQISVITR